MNKTKPKNYYSGLNQKLLAAIPRNVRRVIEFGCADGVLGAEYKKINNGVFWVGVDINYEALNEASEKLDRVYLMDANQVNALDVGSEYDCVVFGDFLEHLISPERFLGWLTGITTRNARMICCIPNMAHASVIAKMLAGDLTYEDSGLLDDTHLRFLSYASVYKNFLNTGWLPDLKDFYSTALPARFGEILALAAQEIGIPKKTAYRNISIYQMIIDCTKMEQGNVNDAARQTVSVVVAVNNDEQFKRNVLRSPGLDEIGAEVIPIRGAKNPAEALEKGREEASGDWIIFCHQDAFFPKGTGRMLLNSISEFLDRPDEVLIGFAGLSGGEDDEIHYSGLVVDRMNLFDHPECDDPISIDEFCIVLSKNSLHKIDPNIGWHVWGTDMCLSAKRDGGRRVVIRRVPLFHNSYNDSNIGREFHSSVNRVFEKYKDIVLLRTLNGNFKRFDEKKSFPIYQSFRYDLRLK